MIENFYAVDYQVHSFRSHDGRASILEQCEKAVEIGLDEIGFSEHKDFDPDDPVVNHFDYDAYMREIQAARKRYDGVLKIRAGVEIDYQKWFEEKIADYLAEYRFDFVIGSVHYVDRQMIMTSEYLRSRDREQAYRDYFQAVRDSVQCGLFDILGHLEYANRRGITALGAYSPHLYQADLISLFNAVLSRGVAFEINTAGLHQGIDVSYPCAETVALFARRAEIGTAEGSKKLSIGSDAHHPDQLGFGYADAARLALQNGFHQICTWENRKSLEIPLLAKSN